MLWFVIKTKFHTILRANTATLIKHPKERGKAKKRLLGAFLLFTFPVLKNSRQKKYPNKGVFFI